MTSVFFLFLLLLLFLSFLLIYPQRKHKSNAPNSFEESVERENIFNVGMEGVAGGVEDRGGGGGGGSVATVYIYARTFKLNKLSCASDYAVSPFREVFNVLKTLYIADR